MHEWAGGGACAGLLGAFLKGVAKTGSWRPFFILFRVRVKLQALANLEEILSRHGLKEGDLDRECPRDIRNDIAVELGADWEMIGLYLEFTLDELGDVRQQHSSQEMCRVALLDIWGKRKGEGATFLKLARAFLRRKRRYLVDPASMTVRC